MTFAQIWTLTMALAAIYLTTKIAELYCNRRDPLPADRGYVPEKWDVKTLPADRGVSCPVCDEYPPGMRYAPSEMVVPKRRKRTHTILIARGGETYTILFDDDASPEDVFEIATRWASRSDLAFDQVDRWRVLGRITKMRTG